MSETSTIDRRLNRSANAEAGDLPLHRAVNITDRPVVAGKFVRVGSEKFWIKGVTYGTFRPSDGEARDYPEPQRVESDFAAMVASGINTIRSYTVPPKWLLDSALKHCLRVMVGLPWEQHIAFLDEPGRAESIVKRVREAVRSCAGHPAILCYAVGNEIPAPIVRWHGRRRTEQFIRLLYAAAKREDPGALVTYVNYPTTEYLHLPFLDFACFNVYLESEDRLAAYLARLQNLAGERPLVLAEIGLDSRHNGMEAQAQSLAWQLRTTFAAGCAGAFVFGWTDEWHRGGFDIEDWDFGLTARDRNPKPALAAVRTAFAGVPFPDGIEWPLISVVVCSYNGARTIRDTLEGLKQIDYPDYEVIVVNDGSKDATPEIAARYDVRLISTENRGLSSARNTGWQAATGEIVAYIDDDAYPDPHWLKFLAHTFMTTKHVGVGGPNIAPAGDGAIADCVANAPGGPVHVLLSDTVAEHIPGCNMAFRRSALAEIGGFDHRYRTAGDDVDVCWRLMQRGGTLGFHAGAMDWHHRRNSLLMYWRQQKGYGKAEALLEEKWPERYNAMGHLKWFGRLYGKGLTQPLALRRSHVYHGAWGTAAYQSLYQPAPVTLLSLPLMPEWYLVILALAALGALGLTWTPLAVIAVPLLITASGASIAQAVAAGALAQFTTDQPSFGHLRKRGLTALLHLIQPAARLIGRLQHGLKPWRRRGNARARLPSVRKAALWSENWRAPEQWARHFEAALREQSAVVICGGDFDGWDLHVRGGLFGAARGLLAAEEHGAGKQLVRLVVRPWASASTVTVIAMLAGFALWAFADAAWIAAASLALIFMVLVALVILDCSKAAGSCAHAFERVRATHGTNVD